MDLGLKRNLTWKIVQYGSTWPRLIYVNSSQIIKIKLLTFIFFFYLLSWFCGWSFIMNIKFFTKCCKYNYFLTKNKRMKKAMYIIMKWIKTQFGSTVINKVEIENSYKRFSFSKSNAGSKFYYWIEKFLYFHLNSNVSHLRQLDMT